MYWNSTPGRQSSWACSLAIRWSWIWTELRTELLIGPWTEQLGGSWRRELRQGQTARLIGNQRFVPEQLFLLLVAKWHKDFHASGLTVVTPCGLIGHGVCRIAAGRVGLNWGNLLTYFRRLTEGA
jgi:hypothetical protein